MEWLTLLLFALCPLMMLFCMRGMLGGKDKKQQSCHTKTSTGATANAKGTNDSSGLKELQVQMAELMEENRMLKSEVEAIKTSKTDKVVELKQQKEVS